MNHSDIRRKLRSQDNIKISLNNKSKQINSGSPQKSIMQSMIYKVKSETKLNNIYIKELKIISNIIKKVSVNSNDSKKNKQIPTLHINGSKAINKKTPIRNSALDLISKLIEVNNESLMKNSSPAHSNENSFCQNFINSNVITTLPTLVKHHSFSKLDRRKHYSPSGFKHEQNIEDKENNSPKSTTSNKKRKKTFQKTLIERKKIHINESSGNLVMKNKKFNKLVLPEPENINNNKKNDTQRNKIHSKNKHLKLPTKFRRNSKDDSTFCLSDHNVARHLSTISNQGKNLLKDTIIHFGLSLISDNKNFQQTLIGDSDSKNNKNNDAKSVKLKNDINLSRLSNKQNEISNSILGLDLDIDKLKKEIYEYENTDITDAINRLPTMKFDNNEKVTSNNEKNEETEKNNIKNIKKKKSNKIKKLNKKIKLNKERHRRIQRKKYIYDSLDDEEYEDVEENNFYFEPDSIFIYIMDFMIFITSFIELFYYPIYLAKSYFYIKFGATDILFYLTDFIFIIDLVIEFFKAYYNFDEFLVKKSSSIIKNYVRNWFIFDFICSIPIYSILKTFQKKNVFNNCNNICYFDYKGNNLYYLFALIKIIKIFKVLSSNVFFKQIKNQLKENNFINDWGSVFIYLILLISILNIGSSIFIFVARNSYPNWILGLSISKKNFVNIYICSVFHLTTTLTTIGYGEIVPQSIAEKVFEIFSIIVGTCLYSWIITSASNYIKKMNEKYIKFEKRKKILDEIKLKYPLLNDCLYDRIYRYLYYGKSHQEVDNNIILETLPYSIRNELLIQMYDPIINNFKLFGYFECSEFIIRIVTLLKPFVCSKGDILVNEGDYIEDIILNNSGILSLDICVDLNRQKESIEEYLTKYNLGKNINSLNQENRKSNESVSSTKLSLDTEKLSQIYNDNVCSSNCINEENLIYNKTKNVKNLKFIKILYIRKKEYFGEVLMFLNEKSPLYIRVHSKKAELFLLRKTDVVSVSSDYPNIWDKINKKSIFNLEQTKNIIARKLTNFCNFYGIETKLLHVKKDQKHCIYSFPNYLMPIPDTVKDDSKSKDSKYSDISKSENIDNISSGSHDHSNYENSNNKISIIKEESLEESNINTSSKRKKNSIKSVKQSMKDSTIKNYKNFSTFSRQSKKMDNSSSSKGNNSLESHNNTNSIISIYSPNNYLSAFWNKNNFNPLSCRVMDNSHYESTITLYDKRKKNTKRSSSHFSKNEFNKSLYPTHSLPSNRAESYEIMRRSRFESDEINDEIYSNELFEIKLQEENDELMSKSLKNTHKTLPLKLLTCENKEKHKKINNSNNNKFNNLKVILTSNIEIKSSYENLNTFTNYKYITDDNLRKKTMDFLGAECGYFSPIPSCKLCKIYSKRKDSKPTKKILKFINTKESFGSPSKLSRNNRRCSSFYKSEDINSSIHPNEYLTRNISKKCDSLIKSGSFYIDTKIINANNLKQTVSIKSKNILRKTPQKLNSISNSSEDFPKKKNTKSNLLSSDILVKKKTKRKMNLISENMLKNKQNLNNPNEFYADLFNNFVVNNRQKNESGASNVPIIKVSYYEEDS